jgi:DNA-binding NarL/FixJ family response regulator
MAITGTNTEAIAAVAAIQPVAEEPDGVQQAAAPKDTVTISATGPELAQPTSTQVQLLHAEGESIAAIAQRLGLTPQVVESYLGIAAQFASA